MNVRVYGAFRTFAKKVKKNLKKVLTIRNNFDKIIFADAPEKQNIEVPDSTDFPGGRPDRTLITEQ